MKKKLLLPLSLIFLASYSLAINLLAQELKTEELKDSSQYVQKAWSLSGKGDFNGVHEATAEVFKKFSPEADLEAAKLDKLPTKETVQNYKIMNDVAICYFIKGEAFRDEGKFPEAIEILQKVINKYPYAQAYDPRGWYWSIKEKAQTIINQIKGIEEKAQVQPTQGIMSFIKLYDEGTEFPVDYTKYGEFTKEGTGQYKYVIKNMPGLIAAVGEGIYPNMSSVKKDPEFIKLKGQLAKIDHWQILNSRDLKTAFYKWTNAPEPEAVKQFYIATLLERSGLYKAAVKAYYAALVHYPYNYGWTYWRTPWYVGRASLYRLKNILRQNPDLGVKLDGAEIIMNNVYNVDVKDDKFISVKPGRLVPIKVRKNVKVKLASDNKRNFGKIIKTKGGSQFKLVQYKSGDWQFLVKDKPFIIKGITYSPTKVGESPDKNTLKDWTWQDTNNNGLIDGPQEAWVDANTNNIQDSEEKTIGDFQLMKDMGVNVIRLYQREGKFNKELLKKLYQDYGIYTALGDFLGKYNIASGGDWGQGGTDYDNETHKKNILANLKKMVLEYKDEPYILLWIIGNENVYGWGCNADKKPESFFKFANEAALMIKSLDPLKRPIAIASGDTAQLDIFAKNCPDIDIFGVNSYRGPQGFLELWDDVKRLADKPVLITEYGAPSYANEYLLDEAQGAQADYHKQCWQDIELNSPGYGAGNALGGFVFEWLDEWWKGYEPYIHDTEGLAFGPFIDGRYHEEWFGICGQGNGKNSPFLRQLRKTYFAYKDIWNR